MTPEPRPITLLGQPVEIHELPKEWTEDSKLFGVFPYEPSDEELHYCAACDQRVWFSSHHYLCDTCRSVED